MFEVVGEEWVAGDGKDGGDGVEGEDDVGELDGEEREEEHRDHGAAGLVDPEVVLPEADGAEPLEPGDPDRRGGRVLLLREQQADGGEEQNGGEDVADPMEACEQAETGGDERAAHEDGAEHAPEEDFGLVRGKDLKDAEEEQEDEEVVDREGLFEGIAGEVLDGALIAESVADDEREGERGGDPEDGGGDGVGVGARRAATADVEIFGGEQRQQQQVEADPVGDGGGWHLCLMVARFWGDAG